VKLIEAAMIKTDFGARSFDLNNDPKLTEYQPLVQKLMATFGPLMKSGSAPEKIAVGVGCCTASSLLVADEVRK
jgi:hypothetical protein